MAPAVRIEARWKSLLGSETKRCQFALGASLFTQLDHSYGSKPYCLCILISSWDEDPNYPEGPQHIVHWRH